MDVKNSVNILLYDEYFPEKSNHENFKYLKKSLNKSNIMGRKPKGS